MKSHTAALFCVAMLLLSGCRETQPPGIVIGDGAGVFDGTQAPVQVTCTDSYTSADDTVTYHINLNTMVDPADAVILDMSPHELTPEDGQRAAKALFGDAPVYEYTPTPQWTKSELEKNIADWTAYSQKVWLEEFHGRSMTAAELEQWQNVLNRYIREHRNLIADAPDALEPAPCQWRFYPATHYTNLSSYAPEVPNSEIRAVTEVDGIPYTLVLSSCMEAGRKHHQISTHISPKADPAGLETEIIRHRLLTSSQPSEAQLLAAEQKALTILSHMGFTDWTVDSCAPRLVPDGTDRFYEIQVDVRTRFLWGEAYSDRLYRDFNDMLDEYDTHYGYPRAQFVFSPEGVLLSCTVSCPLDVTRSPTGPTETLSFDTLFRITKEHLQAKTAEDFGCRAPGGAPINCTLFITGMEYSWTRMQLEASDSYYFVPTVSFYGDRQIGTRDTGELIDDSTSYSHGRFYFLTINAIDGTILN